MIELVFDKTGYYARGERFESAQSVSPRVDPNSGDQVFHDVEHQYAVLIRALTELRANNVDEDVVIYNDSRIIEELNGIITPMFPEMTNAVRRNLIPSIRGCIWFRKRAAHFVSGRVKEGVDGLVNTLDDSTRERKARRLIESLEELDRTQKRSAAKRFKERWLHPGRTDGSSVDRGGNN